MADSKFEELCEPSVRYLLSSDELVAISENTVFHALMHWIEQHGTSNILKSQKLPSLLSVVRFEFITIDYLYNIVQHNFVARKLPDFNNHYLKGISYHALSDFMKQQLPCPPVKRKGSAKSFIPYTWVIQKKELRKLIGTDNKLISDTFWCCGYTMVLAIANVEKFNLSLLHAKLSLAIANLTEQSEVLIQWRLESQCFPKGFETVQHIFKEHANSSNVRIKFDSGMYQTHLRESHFNNRSNSGRPPRQRSACLFKYKF